MSRIGDGGGFGITRINQPQGPSSTPDREGGVPPVEGAHEVQQESREAFSLRKKAERETPHIDLAREAIMSPHTSRFDPGIQRFDSGTGALSIRGSEAPDIEYSAVAYVRAAPTRTLAQQQVYPLTPTAEKLIDHLNEHYTPPSTFGSLALRTLARMVTRDPEAQYDPGKRKGEVNKDALIIKVGAGAEILGTRPDEAELFAEAHVRFRSGFKEQISRMISEGEVSVGGLLDFARSERLDPAEADVAAESLYAVTHVPQTIARQLLDVDSETGALMLMVASLQARVDDPDSYRIHEELGQELTT